MGRINEMLFTDTQFIIIATLFMFALFFIIGYESEKKSGGFFMIFSAFIFFYFDAVASSLFSVFVASLISPFGIFILLIGIRKAFYHVEQKGNVRQKG